MILTIYYNKLVINTDAHAVKQIFQNKCYGQSCYDDRDCQCACPHRDTCSHLLRWAADEVGLEVLFKGCPNTVEALQRVLSDSAICIISRCRRGFVLDLRPLSQLREWADNYNRNDVVAIARSIRRFGFNNALRLWRDDVVIAGNHTLLALRRIKTEGADPDLDRDWLPLNIEVRGNEWYIACVDVTHLDSAEAKAFAIADNQLARQAVADDKLLAQYLQEIAEHDHEMLAATGFDDDSLEALLSSLSEPGFDPEPMAQQPRLDQYMTCDVCGKRLYDR